MPTPECWILPDSTPVALRPVDWRDAAALCRLIEELPARDRRWRFHGAVNGVAPAQLERMVRVDPRRELALVVTATGPAGETLVADARCVVDTTGHDAEFALMVAAPWQRRGVGGRVLAALQRSAASRGLRWLHGSVLADNVAMLGLVRRCGFHCRPHRGGAGLVAVEACLQPPPV